MVFWLLVATSTSHSGVTAFIGGRGILEACSGEKPPPPICWRLGLKKGHPLKENKCVKFLAKRRRWWRSILRERERNCAICEVSVSGRCLEPPGLLCVKDLIAAPASMARVNGPIIVTINYATQVVWQQPAQKENPGDLANVIRMTELRFLLSHTHAHIPIASPALTSQAVVDVYLYLLTGVCTNPRAFTHV